MPVYTGPTITRFGMATVKAEVEPEARSVKLVRLSWEKLRAGGAGRSAGRSSTATRRNPPSPSSCPSGPGSAPLPASSDDKTLSRSKKRITN